MIYERRVLVVDDEPGHRLMLRAVLSERGWTVLEAGDGETALALLDEGADPDVMLCDMRMPGMDGMEVLREVREHWPGTPVVMLTAFGSVGSAVEAMKQGAFDYLTKPADNDEVAAVLDRAYDEGRLVAEGTGVGARPDEALGDGAGLVPALIGDSRAMREVKALMAQVAPTEATVLVLGESGTGKELVAEGVHAMSPRAQGPLIKVNCAALPAALLESELFGYVKGAFTGAVKDKPGRFQLARGGTLFLDEIGEMDPALQAKLLRAIQERVVEPLGSVRPVPTDVRILAATNRDLMAEVKAGRFREDLYYRLNVLEIRIPPLRERLGDIPALVAHLLRKLGAKNRKEVRGVSPEFLEALARYGWPGNVRELENVLERALILSRSDRLTPELLPGQVLEFGPAASETGDGPAAPGKEQPAPGYLEEAERRALVEALDTHGGHREKTAEALGISRRTLQYKLKKYGLTRRQGTGS